MKFFWTSMEKKGTDKGLETLFSFFKEQEKLSYRSKFPLLSQNNPDACVAACARMLLAESKIDYPESWVAGALETVQGAYLGKLPNVSQEFGFKQKYRFHNDLTFENLREAIQGGRAIVSVRRAGDNFGHALIIDDIIDDEIRLRDPLPQGLGESYAVKIEKFLEVWIRSNERGVAVCSANKKPLKKPN